MNLTTSFFLLVFSVLITTTLCYLNPNFQACEPQTCGNGLNVTYPFYIQDKQDRSCGFQNFRLVCASNGFPMLNLSNTLYIVDEIFRHNHSLRVSNPNFPISNSTNCLSPSGNLTIGYRFTFAPNQKEVMLFFDCDSPSLLPEDMKENVVGCFVGNRTRSVLGMAVDDEEKLKYAKDNCRGAVTTTTVENMGGGIREALGRGFLLKPVSRSESGCASCESSGGRCGFVETGGYGFRCLCRDGNHLLTCPPGEEGSSLSLSAPSFITISLSSNAHCSTFIVDEKPLTLQDVVSLDDSSQKILT